MTIFEGTLSCGELQAENQRFRSARMETATFPLPWSSGSQLFSMSPNH
jgi:hypothetical protein